MCDMKTKDKDRHHNQSTSNNENANEKERTPERTARDVNDQPNNRERSFEDFDKVKQTLSGGYYPDGPGGNYRGV
jgi:hypothetical protein